MTVSLYDLLGPMAVAAGAAAGLAGALLGLGACVGLVSGLLCGVAAFLLLRQVLVRGLPARASEGVLAAFYVLTFAGVSATTFGGVVATRMLVTAFLA